MKGNRKGMGKAQEMTMGEARRRAWGTGGKRNRNLRRWAAVLLCILTAFVYTGCGSSGGADSSSSTLFSKNSGGSAFEGGDLYGVNSAPEYEGSAYDMAEYKSADLAAEESGSESLGVLEGRKLIRTVNLETETKEFDQMMSSLEKQVGDMGGYIENMETYNGSGYSGYISSRYANLTVRIPSGKLDIFLQTVSDISNVIRRRDNVEDVTLSYVDMESRRNTLRTEQERLMTFLEKAETVEEIITLEQRLSEVRYQLESMESQLRTMDNLIEYSTVEISISEVRELTEVREEEPGPGKRIVDGFLESLRDIGDGAMEFAIWFLTHIPYLVIWAGVIAVAVICWLKARKRRLRRKAARQREEEARLQAERMRMQEWETGKTENAGTGSETGREANHEL